MDKKIKEYSREGGDLQIVENTTIDKKRPNIFIGTLNVLTKEHRVLGRTKKARAISDIILIILIALGLFLGVSYLIKNYRIGKNIILEARTVNEIITSGNIETFEIEYANKNRESIEDVNITVEFPENFVLENTIPENIFDSHTNTFNLDVLSSKANGKIKITGLVLGEINTQQTMSFSLNYSYQGLQRSSSYSLIYLIEDSVLDLNISFPKEVYQNVSFSGEAVLENKGNKSLENIKLVFDDNILVQNSSSADEITFGNNVVYLNSLGAKKQVKIDIDAIIKDKEGEISFTSNVFANELKQREISRDLIVKVPNFKTSINIDKKFMTIGDEIGFVFNYANNEPNNISNVKFTMQPSNNFIIKSLVLNNSDKLSKQGSTIVFKDDLIADEQGQFSLNVVFSRKKMEINQQAYLIVTISYQMNENIIEYLIYSPKIKILSNLNIKSAGYYYSSQGDQLGTGPIPPIVDIPTNYWIFWEAENFGNDLNEFSMTADLPEGVVWTNDKSLLSGSLQFGEVSRRVIWSIDDINKQSGNYKVRFEIGLIPTQDDVGKFLDLLTNIRYYAYDTFCEAEISGTKENIDTNLKYDNLASGKGKVKDFE